MEKKVDRQDVIDAATRQAEQFLSDARACKQAVQKLEKAAAAQALSDFALRVMLLP